MTIDQRTLAPLGVVCLVVGTIAYGAFIAGKTRAEMDSAHAEIATLNALNIATRLASIEAIISVISRRQQSAHNSSIRRRASLGTEPQ